MKNKSKQFYCATPAPLLWKGLFVIVPVLVIILIVLVSQALIRMYANKKRHKKIIDKTTVILTIWSIVVFLSLISYGIIGLDFNYYLLEFFLLTIFILGAFYIGEHLKLFKIDRSRWIFVASLSIIFAVLFSICFVSAIRQNTAFARGAETTCLNRLLF